MTLLGRPHDRTRVGARGFRRALPLSVLVTLGSLVLAHFIVGNPGGAIIGASLVLAVIVGTVLPWLHPRLFLSVLGLLLVGYAFFGRAFSHLGMPPVFIGEVVLGVGLLSLLTNRRRWAAFQSPIAWLYAAFALWGAARAIPDLPVYGLDTLRDSVIWGYGVFALLVPASIVRPGWIPSLLQRYARWMPLLVLWIPVGLFIGHLFPHLLPLAQDSSELMVFVKPGDAGVHLAGAATFLLLGLHRSPGVRRRAGLLGRDSFMGVACLCAFIALAMLGRGGALAALVGIFTVILIRPLVALPKMLIMGGTAVTAALALLASDFSVELGRRDFSASQLASNLVSIVGDVSDDQRNLEQTRGWRLRWWGQIVDYTVFGPYFLTGKGFGVNLAIDDGIKNNSYNRSPHSGHMSVLARMGAPGAVLWLLLHAVFGGTMLAAYRRACRTGQEWWARLDLWILAYWLAFLTDISFAVYLEGPHGGIWFWSVMGLGIAVALAQRQAQVLPSRSAFQGSHGHETAARP